MKFPKYLRNVFAGLGVLSLIFYTCASESTSDDNSSNLPPQLTGGTYQVMSWGSNNGSIVVLNTETGVMKTYVASGEWIENSEFNGNYPTITFTH
tara:strand:+ start:1195 stop:1479 length:285 start_codon:yes stop_codon:yes gene_type:complete